MGTWLHTFIGNGAGSEALVLLIDVGVKGFALLAIAGVLTRAMGRSTAAARYLVWMLALVGLLLLPVVSMVMPKWQLPLLPTMESSTETLPTVPVMDSESRALPTASAEFVASEAIGVAPPSTPVSTPSLAVEPMHTPVAAPPAPARPVAHWVLAAWLAVALAILLPLLLGLAAVGRLRKKASPFSTEDLPQLARALAPSIGLHRPTTLLCTPTATMPMATGLFRSAVFLPRDAEGWSDEKRRAVLLHELAHVKRRDCLTHALARVALALHWFNPLAWWALRQLRIEREHACDDLVLTAGERPTAYADHLLEIARTMHAGTITSAAAITMAKKNHLEGRLLAVLDGARNRKRVSQQVAAGFGLTALLVTAVIATVQVTRANSDDVVDHITFSSGVHVTLLGVGIPSRDDDTPPWRPDGSALDVLPDDLGRASFPDLEKRESLMRELYLRITAPVVLPGAEPVCVKAGYVAKPGIASGETALLATCTGAERSASTFELNVGVAAGPWEGLAQAFFGNATRGERNGVSYDLMISQPYTRDESLGFTITYSVNDLNLRVVAHSISGEQYVARSRSGSGTGEVLQMDYTLDGIEAADIGIVELQVREFEWRSFSGISTHPAPDLDRDGAYENAVAAGAQAKYPGGIRATVVSVGEPDRFTTRTAWNPDGTPLPTVPQGYDDLIGSFLPHDDEIARRLFIDLTPSTEDLDLGIQWTLDGEPGGMITSRADNKTRLAIHANIPDTGDTATLKLGIATGPWKTIVKGGSNHMSSHKTFGIAFSAFFEVRSRTHIITTHSKIQDDFRLVVFDRNNKLYVAQRASSKNIRGMVQTEFIVNDAIAREDIMNVEFQMRPFVWREISGIALHPDPAKTSAHSPGKTAALEKEFPNNIVSNPNKGLPTKDGAEASIPPQETPDSPNNLSTAPKVPTNEAAGLPDFDYLNSLEFSELLSAPRVLTGSTNAETKASSTSDPAGIPDTTLDRFLSGNNARNERLLGQGIKIDFVRRATDWSDRPEQPRQSTGTLWMLGRDTVVEIRDAAGRSARIYQIDDSIVTDGQVWAVGSFVTPPKEGSEPPAVDKFIGYPVNTLMPGHLLALQWRTPNDWEAGHLRASMENGSLRIVHGSAEDINFISFEAAPVHIDVAPEMGYAVLRSAHRTASDFVEISEGLWFPQRVVNAPPPSADLQGGWFSYHEEIEVTNVTIAPDYPEGLFILPEPPPPVRTSQPPFGRPIRSKYPPA